MPKKIGRPLIGDEPMVTVQFRCRPQIMEWLKNEGDKSDRTMAGQIRHVLAVAMRRDERHGELKALVRPRFTA